MRFNRILITGGAGFVGANLAVRFKQGFPNVAVWAFDNLKRRGSELNLPRLQEAGVHFLHGDIRCVEDIDDWPAFDLLIDCSAEPSVQAGIDGSPLPVLQHNLVGTLNCMEAARRHQAAFLFLSTSRVYPIGRINGLSYQEDATRFSWTVAEAVPGLSREGIAETFPLDGPRSLYGATKLSAELLLQEYAYTYRLPVIINRCGVLTGPWQMGKVDQGVVTLWVARHVFGTPLQYIGFGGTGKQVRDMLHVADLFDLVVRQAAVPSTWDGRVYNVGGGCAVSTSLRELTEVCQQVTGRRVPVRAEPATSPVDIRVYITDSRSVGEQFGWAPRRTVSTIVEDISRWVNDHREQLRPIFNPLGAAA
jgi:CDP-paratose 2-epimerase